MLGTSAEAGERGAPPDYQGALAYYKRSCTEGDPRGCAAAARIESTKPSNAAFENYQMRKIRSQCVGPQIAMCHMLGTIYAHAMLGQPRSVPLAIAAYKHGCDAGDENCCSALKNLQP